MSTQPTRPGENQEFSEEELKRVYDGHVAAERDDETFSRTQVPKVPQLKHPAPQ